MARRGRLDTTWGGEQPLTAFKPAMAIRLSSPVIN